MENILIENEYFLVDGSYFLMIYNTHLQSIESKKY